MSWRHWVIFAWPMVVGLLGCQQNSAVQHTELPPIPPLEVELVSVDKTPIESSVELTGTLVPWKYATIASEVTGVIEEIPESGEKITYELAGQSVTKVLPLDIGHEVKAGDVLVRIRSSEAELALQLAQAKVAAMEKELANLNAWKRPEEVAQLKAQLDESDAILVDARANQVRADSLVGHNAISQKEVDDAARSVATAQAARERAEAALKLAKAGPTVEQIAVAEAQLNMAKAEVKIKQDQLEKCTIRCPLDKGWIVERYVGTGDHVTATPSTPLMRVVDSSLLLAQVNVPQRYLGLIQPHDMATLHVEEAQSGENAEVRAMVVLVNAQVDPETRTFRVRVGIDNNQNLLRAGTFVKVRIPLRAAAESIVVPLEAITFTKGEPAAFVYKDGVVEKRPLVLGISNRTHYQVISGLTVNEQVVKGDLSLLATGVRVQPRVNAAHTPSAPTPVSVATESQG